MGGSSGRARGRLGLSPMRRAVATPSFPRAGRSRCRREESRSGCYERAPGDIEAPRDVIPRRRGGLAADARRLGDVSIGEGLAFLDPEHRAAEVRAVVPEIELEGLREPRGSRREKALLIDAARALHPLDPLDRLRRAN